MWCNRVQKQLSAYADGELAPAQRRRVEEHLGECARCSQEHARLRQLVRLTALVPEEELPLGLHARIMSNLAYAQTAPSAPARVRRQMPLGVWLGTAAGGAVAALAVGIAQSRAMSPIPAAPNPIAPSVTAAAPAPAEVEGPQASAKPPEPAPAEHRAPEGTPQPAPVVTAEAAPSAEPVEASSVLPPPKPMVSVGRKPAPKLDRVPASRIPSAAPLADKAAPSPATDIPASDAAPTTMAQQGPPMMPGDPVVNMTMVPVKMESGMGMPKDPTRMAGSGDDQVMPADEDEGLRNLRSFLEERSQTVPQPPIVDSNSKRDRRMKKSL